MYGILTQRDGNTIAIPTRIIITPEKLVQNTCGIVIKSVDAFKRSVNKITDRERDPITVMALFEIPVLPSSEAPITIGSNGNIHGASTVKIPARTAIAKNIMLLNLRNKILKL
jgi:hypothetical protein